MRHRVERTTCPVCKGGALKAVCTGCHGHGEAIIVHMPKDFEIEIHPITDEARLREQYPDDPTPVHERTTVAQAYLKFLRAAELLHTSPQQQRVMKQLFYAGAWWMLEVLAYQLDPQSEPTADDLEYLQRVSDELKRFSEQVEQGLA